MERWTLAARKRRSLLRGMKLRPPDAPRSRARAAELLAGYLGRIGTGRLLTHEEELDLGRRGRSRAHQAFSRRGGLQFSIGQVEPGHLHGASFADLPFPKKVRDEFMAEGRALVHLPLPDSGWTR